MFKLRKASPAVIMAIIRSPQSGTLPQFNLDEVSEGEVGETGLVICAIGSLGEGEPC
jgi:hypothetical protein